jgi:hypothetical protein
MSLLFTALVAQDKKVEIIPFFGYTASGGIPVSQTEIEPGVFVDRLQTKSGASYGGLFEYYLTENWSVGFNFSQQRSALEGRITSGGTREFTDMKLNNYHGVFTYNMGDEDSVMRPYFQFGLGATQFSPDSISGQNIDSMTKFSPMFAGGVKYFFSENIGFRGGVRWIPSYIYSTSGGVWCSPWWPWSCWIIPDDHLVHQGEFSAGVVFRF